MADRPRQVLRLLPLRLQKLQPAVEGDIIANIGILQRKDKIRLVAKEGAVYVDTISPMHKYVIHPDPESIKIVDTV